MSRLLRLTDEANERQLTAVFIHGLGGDAYDTWRQSAIPGSLWPLWLAKDIPGLAVYTAGYDAPVSRWRGTAMHLIDRASNLLERFLVEPDLQNGPLILIGHSLGGLVIKQLLRIAESQARNRTEAADLLRRVKKIAFLATPHTGSSLAVWGDRLRILIFPSAATASLVRNDPNLRDLNLWYRDWSSSSGVAQLILSETKPTSILGLVVRPDSSDPGIVGARPVPIDANHIEISKPDDRSSDVYVQVRAFIQRQIRPPSTPEEKQTDGLTIFQTADNQPRLVNNVTHNITINISNSPDSMDQLAEIIRALGSLKESGALKAPQE